MARTFFHTTNLDDEAETEVTVEYTCSGGCPAHYGSLTYPGHPAEDPEVEILSCWRSGGEFDKMSYPPKVELTDAQYERIVVWILENPPEDDYDYD